MVYMNGAIADPCVSTISAPKMASTINTGISQNFFLAFMKAHNSETNDSIDWSLEGVRIDSSSVEVESLAQSNMNLFAGPT